MRNSNIMKLCVSAIMLALAFVLSFVKIVDFAWGGSITLLSMLPICLVSIKYGLGWGLGTSFCYALLQFFQGLGEAMSWGLTPETWIGMILFDYLIAFTVLGLAGLLRKQGRIGCCLGICIALGLRYVSSVLSGAIVWKSIGELAFGWTFDNTWVYSLVYNALYMIPEIVLTVVAAVLILSALPQIKKWILPQN